MNKLLCVLMGAYFGVLLVKSEVASWFRIQKMFRFEDRNAATNCPELVPKDEEKGTTWKKTPPLWCRSRLTQSRISFRVVSLS